jgi:superfamily II DNA helicase RecQ
MAVPGCLFGWPPIKNLPAPWSQGFRGLTPEHAQKIGDFQGNHAVYCCSMRPIAPQPYVIFHDTTLIALASRRPQSLTALEEIPGMGERKIERYGRAMLAIIRGEDEALGAD